MKIKEKNGQNIDNSEGKICHSKGTMRPLCGWGVNAILSFNSQHLAIKIEQLRGFTVKEPPRERGDRQNEVRMGRLAT
jgi:hypothetical protein